MQSPEGQAGKENKSCPNAVVPSSLVYACLHIVHICLQKYKIIFVTLQEFAGFLYIKAVWEIEEKQGYDLETVLNSTFFHLKVEVWLRILLQIALFMRFLVKIIVL